VSSKKTLNEVFSAVTARRRYEVWFVRLGLADGSGAWWFRYLLMNPGLAANNNLPRHMPVQVWATWFPRDARPHTVIQSFPIEDVDLSARGENPFHFHALSNEINENSCRGALNLDGHTVAWNLNYHSRFQATLSDLGWIGFSRTPHCDATFSGEITLNGQTVTGDPLGFGLQGHNCGYRHRGFWTWTHAYFSSVEGASTLEALMYDMPLGLLFRKAVLWHKGSRYIFRGLKEVKTGDENLSWQFRASTREGLKLECFVSARAPNIHQLAYEKTDGSGSFQVLNSSLAHARLSLRWPDEAYEELETTTGAVIEIGGDIQRRRR
jgi:hypothetical protein